MTAASAWKALVYASFRASSSSLAITPSSSSPSHIFIISSSASVLRFIVLFSWGFIMPLADGPTVRGECGKIGWDLVLPGFLSILDKLGDLVQAAGRKYDLAFRKENVLP